MPGGASRGRCVGGGGLVGLGWVVARTRGGSPRPVCPSLTGTTGSHPGCLVSQPSRLLTTPEPHQGAGGREMLPCLCVSAARVRGWAGGTPGLTMCWCLALLVLRGVFSLPCGALLVSLPCAGTLLGGGGGARPPSAAGSSWMLPVG